MTSTSLDPRQMLLHMLPKGGVGVEIGVLMGDFSDQLLRVTQPKKLYLIDPWKHFETAEHASSLYGGAASSPEIVEQRYRHVTNRFRAQTEAGVVEIIRDMSFQATRFIADQSLDYVYVDGDHNEAGVKADIKAFWPKLRTGGIMAFDDYNLGGWWKDGVISAVHAHLSQARCLLVLALGNQVALKKL